MKVPFWQASVRAAPAPIYPTHIPHAMLVKPTISPAAKTLYEFLLASWKTDSLFSG
jgi:hypothetical protein